MVGEETSDEERSELRETLGLMDPIHVQFSRFVVNASRGEFGISYQLRRPVSELITERLPATIELVLISALIALVSGTLLGVYTGINRKGFLSDIILAISLLGVSLPTFVIGILFIGSPTKVKRENDTNATTSITKTDWNNLFKVYLINFWKL